MDKNATTCEWDGLRGDNLNSCADEWRMKRAMGLTMVYNINMAKCKDCKSLHTH